MNIVNNTALTILECHSNPNLTTLTCNNAFDFTTTHISINKGLKILNTSGSVLTPSVGDLITVNLCKGVVFSASNGSFKIVSVDETKLAWSTENKTTNAKNWDDGMANMNTIKTLNSNLSKYPAFKWCNDYGTDWYLPAYNELSALHNNRHTIQSTLSANGYTSLTSDYYWSSSEVSSTKAYDYDFNPYESTGDYNKTTYHYVRAILAF